MLNRWGIDNSCNATYNEDNPDANASNERRKNMDNQFNGFDPQQGAQPGFDAEGYKLLPEGVMVTKVEYRKAYAPKDFQKMIRSSCIALYVFLGISAVLAIIIYIICGIKQKRIAEG